MRQKIGISCESKVRSNKESLEWRATKRIRHPYLLYCKIAKKPLVVSFFFWEGGRDIQETRDELWSSSPLRFPPQRSKKWWKMEDIFSQFGEKAGPKARDWTRIFFISAVFKRRICIFGRISPCRSFCLCS